MNIENIRDKIGPWMPAVVCGIVTVMVMIGYTWEASAGRSASIVQLFFNGFMFVCFFLVGEYLVKLKKEIAELRERLDAADHRSDSAVAPSEHRPENDSGEQDDAGKPDPAAS